jgi:hypothetical protein
MIELTGFTKHGGPLTKRISLAADGSLCSDGSQCQMAAGSAQRVRLPDLDAFARLIGQLPPEEAIGLGALRGDLPEMAEITTKAKIEALNGSREKLPIWGSVPRTVSARELSLAADIRLPRPGAEAGPCIRVW